MRMRPGVQCGDMREKLRPGAGLQEKNRRDRSSSRVAGEEGESDLASWVIWPNLRGL